MFDLRMSIYRHLQRLDLSFYDRNPVGRLMTRVTSDVDVLNDLFTSGVITVFGDVFALVGIMVMMLWMNWRLALVAFAVLPLVLLVTQWFRRNVRDSYRVVRGWIARINAFLQENITGMTTVQLFRREAVNFERFDEIDRKHRDANIESIFYYAVFYPAIEAIARARLCADHLVRGGASSPTRSRWERWWRFSSTPAVLPAHQRHVREVQRPPIGDGLVGAHFRATGRAGGDSVGPRRRLDGPQAGVRAISSSKTCGSRTRRPGARRRRCDVGNDADANWVLRDMSFEVRPGQRVGIVGATGSGKTTLVSLLLRFYDVQRGRITVDGVDMRDMDLADLRGLFSLVLQDVHLFTGTIADNIRLGDATIDDERVRRAARAVHADAFISRMPRVTAARLQNEVRRCQSGRSSCCRLRGRWRLTRACSFSTKRLRASIPKRS